MCKARWLTSLTLLAASTAHAAPIECKGSTVLDGKRTQVTVKAELDRPREIESVWITRNGVFALSLDHAFAVKRFNPKKHPNLNVRKLRDTYDQYVLRHVGEDGEDQAALSAQSSGLVVDHELSYDERVWELLIPVRANGLGRPHEKFRAFLRANSDIKNGKYPPLDCRTLPGTASLTY